MSYQVENSTFQRDSWRIAGMAITVLLLLTLVMYQQTVVYLMGLWNHEEVGNYAHGYLVLMISAYLVFYNRQRLAWLTPCPEYKALLAVVAAIMVWLVAALVDIEMLKTVGLLLLLLSLVWLVLGTRAIRILAFPLLFIGFAIPVWFPLSPMLQELTADVVFWVVRVLEIPAFRVENMIVVPSGTLSVEESCGGLNYFLAAMTLATLYAYLNYETFYGRVMVVLVTALAAVLVNIIRVFILVYLGYSTDMQHPLVEDHLSFGWYLFAGLVVVLLVADVQFQKFRQRQHHSNETLHTEEMVQGSCNKGKVQFIIISLVAATLVSVGPISVYWLSNQGQQAGAATQMQQLLVPSGGEWSVASDDADDWVPLYHGAIAQKMTFDNNIGQQVHIYVGLYLAQKQGEELINSSNSISDEKIWFSGYQREKLYDAGERKVLEQVLEKKDGTKRLVWYWYHVAGQDTVNKYYVKALQVLGLMNGMRQASVIAIATSLEEDPESTRHILEKFAEEVGPSIDEMMDAND